MIYVVSFSGGRTSARFIETMQARAKELGITVKYVFMDTGGEHPETYDFIRKVVRHFNIDLVCLRLKVNPKLGSANSYTIISLDDTKPDLGPWNDMLRKYSTPYNPGGMFCTDRMKLVPYIKYCDATFGKKGYKTCLGIRYDEPKRIWGDNNKKKLSCFKQLRDEGYAATDDMIDLWREIVGGADIHGYGFSEDLVTAIEKRITLTNEQNKIYMAEYCDDEKQDVLNFWKKQPFDLGIPEHLGNCVFCPKKGLNKIALAARDEPEMAVQFQAALESPTVRIVERRKTPHLEMYRERSSFGQVIQMFADVSREDLAARQRGAKQNDAGSCSESCEMFNDESVTPEEVVMEAYNGNTTTPAEEANLAQTPEWFVKALEKQLRMKFLLDVCAIEATAKCENYYSLLERGENSLELPWAKENFCNPPYNDITPWVDKAIMEAGLGRVTAMLIPDKPEVGYIRKSRHFADTMIHMPFRLKFLRPNGEKFLDKKGKEQGPKFPVTVVLFTPWGINMSVRDMYVDFRSLI